MKIVVESDGIISGKRVSVVVEDVERIKIVQETKGEFKSFKAYIKDYTYGATIRSWSYFLNPRVCIISLK